MGLDVSVVVPCHGAARTVPTLVDSLAAQTLPPDRYEVLLVDPGVDGTRRVIEDLSRRSGDLRLRRVEGPLRDGPAAKRNVGAAAAQGRLLAFTDADCAPDREWLEAGLAAAEGGAELVQGPTLPPAHEPVDILAHAVAVDRPTGLHETSNMFYGRALFERMRGFTTRYYRRLGAPFGEDAELGWRARRAGARFSFEPGAVVRHPAGRADIVRHLRERWLARAFPELVRDIPELRVELLFARWFLTARSAAFASSLLAAALSRRTPAAGFLAIPYARTIGEQLPPRSAGARARARLVAARVVSDSVTLAALLYGSARARRLVL